MSENPEPQARKKSRLRWVTLGEAIAIAALILSGLGLWHEWQKIEDEPAVSGMPAAIPLVLRGEVRNEGRKLQISPIEKGHALQSLTVTVAGKTLALGSDGELDADAIEDALGSAAATGDRTHHLQVRIAARYVEAGADKSATGSYLLSYKWKDKLIGGKSLRLVGLNR